ncbi:MAG: NTP transferase domain-containing protein [Candidatus Aenigmatarchaeota archaeon]|nr:MAG: NTP transferase domain-containing protein [Candidatus Aenigmarchaeota archaeon]
MRLNVTVSYQEHLKKLREHLSKENIPFADQLDAVYAEMAEIDKKLQMSYPRPDALILCGGNGTRFAEGKKPKVLAEVNGRIPLEYTIDTLAKLNFDKAFISVGGPHGDSINAHLKEMEAKPIGLLGLTSRPTIIESVDYGRLMSHLHHISKANGKLIENGCEPLNPNLFDNELDTIVGVAAVAYTAATQPPLTVVLGDSIYQEDAISWASGYYTIEANMGLTEMMPGTRGISPRFPYIKPLVHVMENSTEAYKAPVPKIHKLFSVRKGPLSFDIGRAVGFTEHRTKRVAISVVSPLPFDYRIIFRDNDDPAGRSLPLTEDGSRIDMEKIALPGISYGGFLSHLKEVQSIFPPLETGSRQKPARLPPSDATLELAEATSSLLVMRTNFKYFDIDDEETLAAANDVDIKEFIANDPLSILEKSTPGYRKQFLEKLNEARHRHQHTFRATTGGLGNFKDLYQYALRAFRRHTG